MSKIVHAQTVLFEDDLLRLKQLTDETCTKDALAKAVAHFLKCAGGTQAEG